LRSQGYTFLPDGRIHTHSVDGVTTTYGYDGEGQLLSETRPGYSAAYTYDGNYNRLTRTVNGVLDIYHYAASPLEPHADRLLRVTRAGSPDRVFEHDLAGRTTAERAGDGGPVVRSFVWDSEGRLASATGPWGTRSYAYNGSGARVRETGGASQRDFFRAGASVLEPVLRDGVGAYGYAGGFGYHADPTGLHQVGHRYYDPDLGRFLSRDPVKDGPNWYAYCENDPVNSIDPTGLIFWKVAYAALVVYGWIETAREIRENPDDPLVYLGLIPVVKKFKWAMRAIERGKKACFVAGTPVRMAAGSAKPIEEVRSGDLVASADERTGEKKASVVTAAWSAVVPETPRLTFSDGSAVETTSEPRPPKPQNPNP
jgi:RHS repeat-associated protein